MQYAVDPHVRTLGTGSETEVSGQFDNISQIVTLDIGFKIAKSLGVSSCEAGAAHANFNNHGIHGQRIQNYRKDVN
jgi:hypothetical protein